MICIFITYIAAFNIVAELNILRKCFPSQTCFWPFDLSTVYIQLFILNRTVISITEDYQSYKNKKIIILDNPITMIRRNIK